MARYQALARLALKDGLIETGQEFESDAIPGTFWHPLDKAAEAAVAKRDKAVTKPAPAAGPDPRVAELEAALKEAGELAELRDAENAELKTSLEAVTAERDALKEAGSKK
ncbi:hypothetical protein [Brevundimonas sp.]|uniref:hypothetical protein n=1 Tax=Brevundimonas sp. TaxID=1871086 RepID=UPI0025BF1F47|nr:hypothetical protein [Brevundimonas sp.]